MGPSWRGVRALLTVHICIYYGFVQGLSIDMGSAASIKLVSRQLADSAMRYYDGNKPGKTPGIVSAAGEYNWWEAGALFGEMVEYWHLTGDSYYNDIVKQALLFQVGPNNAYEPENQTRTEGNDDQAFWALAAMSAAETKFSNPAPNEPQWLALAQAVFNNQARRWDDETCGGGLRWQFNPLNGGFNMKNTISNGCFFQLAARLARYTKNDTYAYWANKSYDWMSKSQSPVISDKYQVYDSVTIVGKGCSEPDYLQWSYNVGTLLAGTAYMYNYTNGASIWKTRLDGFLSNSQKVFFPGQYGGGKIMTEWACEPIGNCNRDQRSFKAYFSRWLSLAAQLAPYSAGTILPLLQTSASAAVSACSGNSQSGIVCGRTWYQNKDDGERDIGNQMSALGVVQANLIQTVAAPLDTHTGTSAGNPGAGGIDSIITADDILATRPFTAADRAGAWLITIILFLSVIALGVFLVVPDDDIGIMFKWWRTSHT